jgi:hypothetical protein
VPTIAVRDLKIHRRDRDLVGASFGRGFYVLDDYSPLRALASGAATEEATLFPVRDAWWYVPHQVAQAPGRPELGTDDFTAANPPFGALLTYYLSEAPTTSKDARQAEEKKLRDKGSDVAFPGFDRLFTESVESGPKVLLAIADSGGRAVRWIEGPAKAGLHQRLNESDAPSIGGRVNAALAVFDSRQLPTATQRRDVEIATTELAALSRDLDALVSGEMAKLRDALDAAGAPWTPRR